VQSLVIDPRRPATVYAGTERDGVFASTDRGSSWRRLARGLLPVAIPSLAVDPDDGRLYAGTYGGGVFDYRAAG
jgi:hypothetical protein